jgi:hypothetical protein
MTRRSTYIDMDRFVQISSCIYVITGKYFINVINRYRSMDMILLQDDTLLIGHYCICPHVSSLQLVRDRVCEHGVESDASFIVLVLGL